MKFGRLLSFAFRWVAPVVVLASSGFFVYAMGSRPTPERKKAPVKKSIPVETLQARVHTGPLDLEVSGVAIPFREVAVSSRVGGEVVFKADALSRGHYVEQGELLARIDPTDYKLQVANLTQELEQARLELERLSIDRTNTERLLTLHQEIVTLRENDLGRTQQLGRASAASKSNVETSQLALLSAKEEVTNHENSLRRYETDQTSLKNSIALAALRLEKAELELQRTEIRAPFAGVVIANHVEQNSHVSAGGVIATLEDTSAVEVRCHLRSEDMPFVLATPPSSQTSKSTPRPGAAYQLPSIPVTIEYERGGHVCRWDGVLSRQDGLGVDEATRTVPVRIRVSQPVTRAEESLTGRTIPLMRGMFVKVFIHCRPAIPIAVFPESVLRPGKSVWIMEDGRLQMRAVEIAAISNGQAYVDLTNTPQLIKASIISSPVPNVREGVAVALLGKPNGKGKSRRPEATREGAAQPATLSREQPQRRQASEPVAKQAAQL